ncbi:MAG: hypothetical protein ACE15E_05260 [Acidobacteriota bacterium]
MRAKALTCLVVVVFCFAWSFALETAYLPQVANGTIPGVFSIRTTFIIFNPSTASDTVTIHLTGDSGAGMTVTIPGLGTDDEFGPFSIGPGETKIFQTSGSGDVEAGAARVESQHPLGLSAIFTMYDANGAFLTEAGVGASLPMTNFVIPVDASAGFNTGVALFAPQATSITYTLRRTDGSLVGTLSNIPLGERNHLAKFVAGSGGLFPNATNFTRGTLELACTTPVAGVVLRQIASPLSNTTLPVVDKSSTKTEFNLPQIANGGDLAGINIRTTFIVFNISAAPANVTITVRKPAGVEFPVTVAGSEPPSLAMSQPDASAAQSGVIQVTLQPGASAFLQTSGTGALSEGSAQVTSNVPIGVSAIYTLYNGQVFMTEAGVGDSPVGSDFTLPVNFSADSGTGFALFNVGDLSVTIDIWLVDEAGFFAGRIANPIILPGHNQYAKLIAQIFEGKTSFRGTMCISVTSGTGEVCAVTLQQNSNPLTYTTLPVVEGSFEGNLFSVSALLDQEKTDISATAHTTVDATLPPGLKISGTISGAVGTVNLVSARSTAAGGRTYVGWVDNQTKRYVVIVPAGTYELAICYLPESPLPLGVPTLNYAVQPAITVNADKTQDINVPQVGLNLVTGTITGIDQIGATAGLLTLSSADGKTGVNTFLMANVPYNVQLPAGTYNASLRLTVGQNMLSFLNVGTVNVPGTGNFAVPATVQLSGTVSQNGVPGSPANTFLTAMDTSAPVDDEIMTDCMIGTSTNTTQVGAAGAYQLLVPKDRPLAVGVGFPVGVPPYGNAGFPWPGRALGALGANRTENFDLPTLPPPVQISGKVTNSQGQGVMGVEVSAFSSQITGAPGIYFVSGAETDMNGHYTVQVLSGTGYRLTFTPPSPAP